MGQRLKVGVVGAGVFGGYHAGKCAAHPDIDFIGIFDPDTERCGLSAQKHGTGAFSDYDALLEQAEAIIIASPAFTHFKMAQAALEAGKHTFVEKPLSTTYDEAAKLVELAEDGDLILQVGHQERFVVRAIGLDKVPEKPVRIDARRLNPFHVRGTDTSVVLDLMTHDIDLVLWLMGESPASVKPTTRRVKTDYTDHAIADLIFSDNRTARVEASRLAEIGQRTMVVEYPGGTVSIDFNAKTLVHNTPFDLNENFGDNPSAKDSLGAGTAEFVQAIMQKRKPLVSGKEGLAAVAVAMKIDE